MPVYRWRNTSLPTQVETSSPVELDVLRQVSEAGVPPTTEECIEAGVLISIYPPAKWVRVYTAPAVAKGPAWGAGKGRW